MVVGEAVTARGIVAGIGCRRGVTADEVLAAVAAAQARWHVGRLDALATLPAKRGEPGIAEAARRLGVPHVAAAGAGARLLGPRLILGRVTCAMATGDIA